MATEPPVDNPADVSVPHELTIVSCYRNVHSDWELVEFPARLPSAEFGLTKTSLPCLNLADKRRRPAWRRGLSDFERQRLWQRGHCQQTDSKC
jgi:hypothetical protein